MFSREIYHEQSEIALYLRECDLLEDLGQTYQTINTMQTMNFMQQQPRQKPRQNPQSLHFIQKFNKILQFFNCNFALQLRIFQTIIIVIILAITLHDMTLAIIIISFNFKMLDYLQLNIFLTYESDQLDKMDKAYVSFNQSLMESIIKYRNLRNLRAQLQNSHMLNQITQKLEHLIHTSLRKLYGTLQLCIIIEGKTIFNYQPPEDIDDYQNIIKYLMSIISFDSKIKLSKKFFEKLIFYSIIQSQIKNIIIELNLLKLKIDRELQLIAIHDEKSPAKQNLKQTLLSCLEQENHKIQYMIKVLNQDDNQSGGCEIIKIQLYKMQIYLENLCELQKNNQSSQLNNEQSHIEKQNNRQDAVFIEEQNMIVEEKFIVYKEYESDGDDQKPLQRNGKTKQSLMLDELTQLVQKKQNLYQYSYMGGPKEKIIPQREKEKVKYEKINVSSLLKEFDQSRKVMQLQQLE